MTRTWAGVEVEGGDEFVLDAEGALGSGPDGELAGGVELGDGGAGLERGVGDVLDGVGLGEGDGVGGLRGCGCGLGCCVSAGRATAAAAAGFGRVLEVVEDGLVGGLLRDGPLGFDGGDGLLGGVGVGRDDADEVAVADEFDARAFSRRRRCRRSRGWRCSRWGAGLCRTSFRGG